MGDRAAKGENTEVIARLTRGMIFIGTPFRGSPAAVWAERFRAVFYAFGESNKAILLDLKTKSDALRFLGNAFPAVLRKRDLSDHPEERIEVAFFLEELKTSGMMVGHPKPTPTSIQKLFG